MQQPRKEVPEEVQIDNEISRIQAAKRNDRDRIDPFQTEKMM